MGNRELEEEEMIEEEGDPEKKEEEEEEEARDEDGKYFQKGDPPPALFFANGATISRKWQRLSRSVMRLLASGVPETEILCRALRRFAITRDWDIPADSIF